jgi:hypothetical protein
MGLRIKRSYLSWRDTCVPGFERRMCNRSRYSLKYAGMVLEKLSEVQAENTVLEMIQDWRNVCHMKSKLTDHLSYVHKIQQKFRIYYQ